MAVLDIVLHTLNSIQVKLSPSQMVYVSINALLGTEEMGVSRADLCPRGTAERRVEVPEDR